MARREWPRLSQLNGPKHPRSCQRCEASLAADEVTRWLEHNQNDRPEPIVVVLCSSCAETVIEPHPRLYRELPPAEPFPGAMAVCVDCPHRFGVTCKSPAARINGGPGLTYEPMPQRVHLCRAPRSRSGWTWIGRPIESCSGKEAAHAAARQV